MKVLVLGESGQLARHLKELLPQAAFWGRNTFDLANSTGLPAAVRAFAPSVIVNAAAYSAVDNAESEPAMAWRINADAVAVAAKTATELDVPFLHVSTDYVFDGRKTGEYLVDDAPQPINTYGITKLAGELAVRALAPKHWILRTSWLFSEHGTSFVKTILQLARTRNTLNVVANQRGRPTYAGDLARAIAEIIARGGTDNALPYGIYHAVGDPIVSRHELAEDIVRLATERGLLQRGPSVNPIPSAEYQTAARRPLNSALQPSVAIATVLGIQMDWRSRLGEVLGRLQGDEPPTQAR
jgi:dTDP-4-dehydrorhamnose reductase